MGIFVTSCTFCSFDNSAFDIIGIICVAFTGVAPTGFAFSSSTVASSGVAPSAFTSLDLLSFTFSDWVVELLLVIVSFGSLTIVVVIAGVIVVIFLPSSGPVPPTLTPKRFKV